MRRTITMIVVVALVLLVAVAGVAVARVAVAQGRNVHWCPDPYPDTQGGKCRGTQERDDLNG
jgi:hypothetical protein